MTWTDIFYATEKVFQKCFNLMPMIGQKYNYLMIVGGFIGLAIWLKMQADYNKQAEKNGTLK